MRHRRAERLDRLGLTPTLAVADGYLGYPQRASYNRIIATASLRQVPPAWLGQTRPGGTILTDLRGDFGGNLARLTVNTDQTAHRRFLPETVRFMPLRSVEQPTECALPELSSRAVREPGEQRTTSLDPTALRKRAFGLTGRPCAHSVITCSHSAGHDRSMVTVETPSKRTVPAGNSRRRSRRRFTVNADTGLQHVATFCGQCNCGCPELFVDHQASEERRVVITDDFGQRIQMSMAQLHALVSDVKDGALDELVATP